MSANPPTTDTLLHDITLLERQLHGIVAQRECMGVNNKNMDATEDELKKQLMEKKQLLRSMMESGEKKIPREPALIKNGIPLEMLAQILQIEEKLCSSLPVLEIKPVEATVLAKFDGPAVVNCTPDDGEPNRIVHPSTENPCLAACSLSTYPHVQRSSDRQGDPVCDRFCVDVHKNGVIAALADGCNWGRLPYEAANRASSAFIQYLESRLSTINSLRGAGSLLLAALSAADRKITEGLEKWEAGTTTLIGGLLLPLAHSNISSAHAPPLSTLSRSSSWSSSNSLTPVPMSPGRTRAGSTSFASSNLSSSHATSAGPKWVFVVASLGDCKAFHYMHRSNEFTDITEGNRQNLTDARDPGGRLGPYIDGGPDLRNLHLYYRIAEKDDIILLMSDGVHDNFDPQQLGISPEEAQLEGKTWEEAEKLNPARVELYKNNFRKKWLGDTFAKHFIHMQKDGKDGNNSDNNSGGTGTTTSISGKTLDVKTVVDVLLQHCVNITKTSREFMEQNPKQKLPSDFKNYPGKLDHATCVCIRVGHFT